MSDTEDTTPGADCEVVVVGGGPAGAAAGVYTARYGLDTVVFDRGAGSLDRCAFIGNYLGFPAGVDVETFEALAHDHLAEAGADLVPDLVKAVRRTGDGGFVVETQDDRRVTAEYVLAATRYDGEYLRPLGGEEMFEVHEHGGEEHEHFDPDYADGDGRTPVDGLYVASPAGQRDVQALVAAGHGAHVARTLLEDHREARGYPTELARHYDWLRPDSEFEGEWGGRERWREWFDERVPEDHDGGGEELEALRREYIDDAFATRRSDADVADLTERAHRRLLDHIDDDLIRERAAELDVEATETD